MPPTSGPLVTGPLVAGAARPRASAVMFDLDGTLVQTRAASWAVFREVSDEFGLGLTSPQEYFALFRGNLFDSIAALCQGRADSEQVTAAFLARLRAEYNPAMVPGIVEVVRLLAGHCTLAVVSSNATEVLRRVLVGNGVAYCFAHVFGGDAVPDKSAAIRSFLADDGSRYGRRCEVAYDETAPGAAPQQGTTVLVTDTAGDVQDAVSAGIRAVGVSWGMHSADELTAAGAEFVAIWPQELPGYLLGDAVREPAGACALPIGTAPPGAIAGYGAGAAPGPGAARATAPGPAGSCGAEAGECHCGCAGPEAPGPAGGDVPRRGRTGQEPTGAGQGTAQVTAAALRRGRRVQAVRALRGDPARTAPRWPGSAPPGRDPARPPAPGAGGDGDQAAELRDAVRRILGPGAS